MKGFLESYIIFSPEKQEVLFVLDFRPEVISLVESGIRVITFLQGSLQTLAVKNESRALTFDPKSIVLLGEKHPLL